jgi:hypothetical protein
MPAAAEVPEGLRGWMSFVGIVTLVLGVFNVLTCIGLIHGVLLIFASIGLLGARSALDGARVDATMLPFLQKLKTFMVMTGWTYIVAFIVFVIGVAIYAVFFAAMFATAMGEAMQNSGF